jgi:uncharacterized membrane protein YdjX (TVP38/TMEM64 family)
LRRDRTRLRAFIRPAAIILLAAVIIAAALFVGSGDRLHTLLESNRSLGNAAPLVYIAAYALACVLALPGSLFTIGAGFIFGMLRGSIYALTGATAGATLAFLIGRYLARGWVQRKIEPYPKFRAIDEAVGREGWKIVLLTRLSPIFPFNLLNYAYGLTRVRLVDYVTASLVGFIPGLILYVYIGSIARTAAELGSAGAPQTPARWLVEGVGLIATIALAIYASRTARRALAAVR